MPRASRGPQPDLDERAPEWVWDALWKPDVDRVALRLVDTVLIDRASEAPEKWLFTSKSGEVLKKKDCGAAAVQRHFLKIAAAQHGDKGGTMPVAVAHFRGSGGGKGGKGAGASSSRILTLPELRNALERGGCGACCCSTACRCTCFARRRAESLRRARPVLAPAAATPPLPLLPPYRPLSLTATDFAAAVDAKSAVSPPAGEFAPRVSATPGGSGAAPPVTSTLLSMLVARQDSSCQRSESRLGHSAARPSQLRD